eukprot:12910345-Alexandrium_andersonii.AAC.1
MQGLPTLCASTILGLADGRNALIHGFGALFGPRISSAAEWLIPFAAGPIGQQRCDLGNRRREAAESG